MTGNEVFLEWLKNTLALRPPKNYYIDSERGNGGLKNYEN